MLKFIFHGPRILVGRIGMITIRGMPKCAISQNKMSS